MTLIGGASSKIGIRYEGLWTVLCMIRVMQEEAEWIWLERAGQETEGFEFSLGTPSGVEYHQVKRQKTGMGKWSLPVLSNEEVLADFYRKLNELSANCVFVSAHAADVLEELATRARKAGSWQEFDQEFIASDKWSTEFSSLHKLWKASTKDDSYQRLRRVHVHTIDEDLLSRLVGSALEVLVNGNPANVSDVLFKFGLDEIYQKLDSQRIWNHLASRGLTDNPGNRPRCGRQNSGIESDLFSRDKADRHWRRGNS